MKFYKIIFFTVLVSCTFSSYAQKVLSDGILVYNISVETGSAKPKMADAFDGATITVYLKDNISRTEMVSGLGSEATIHNAATGSSVILKEYSDQKLMTTLSADNWEEINKKFDGITFENTSETVVISGYNCHKAIAKLKNGSTFTVYYTTEVKLANKNYDYQFKNLPGLPVQYEQQSDKLNIKLTLSKISFDNIPSSKFEIPKSGFRIQTYDETKK
ncbi:MAG: DUF4412 domain-containing protein [Ginsengibacter sp.]